MISYDGSIYFGLAGDRDVISDLDDLAAALRESLREQPVPRRKPAASKAKPSANRRPRRSRGADLSVDEDRRAERHPGEQGDHVRVRRPQAAV